MITVDDGVRRLRLLDAKGKVWTQEMLLQVEEKSVSLMDQETRVRSSLSACETTCTQLCARVLLVLSLVGAPERTAVNVFVFFRTSWRTSPS